MNIGFIGLGRMGRGMASNMLHSGYSLIAYDVDSKAMHALKQQGATTTDSIRMLGEKCPLVFTSLPTPDHVREVATGNGGLIESLAPGSTWFDMSTNAVDVVRNIHAQALARDIHFLDAPVSGGPAGSENGDLAVWAGGDAQILDDHRDILNVIASQVRHLGPIGAGTVAKLAHNMASMAMSAVLAETLTLGVKAGVDPLDLWEAMRSGAAGRSRSFDSVARRFLQGRLDSPHFALDLACKDMTLGIRLARDSRVPMRLCNLVLDELTEAANRGWGDRASQSFLLLQQQRAGLDPFDISEADIEAVLART